MHSRVWSSLAALVVIFSLIAQPILPVQASSLNQGEGPRTAYNAGTGMLSFLGADPARPILVRAAQAPGLSPSDRGLAMIEPYAEQFGLSSPKQELTLMTSDQDGGRQITRYQQVYQGIPVLAGELIVNADGRGLLSLSGEVSPKLDVDINPAITAEQALESTLQAMAKWYQTAPEAFTATAPELWIYDSRLLGGDVYPLSLVWRMEITSLETTIPVNELILIDAQRGSIALHFNQVDHYLDDARNEVDSFRENPALGANHRIGGQRSSPRAGLTTVRLPVAAPAMQTSSYYVAATGGSDANSCLSPADPCTTINGAAALAADGDVILVETGIYTGTGREVARLMKDLILSGGWNHDFSKQTGFSTLDGENARRGLTIGVGNGNQVEDLVDATVDRFIFRRGGEAPNPFGFLSGGGALLLDHPGIVTIRNSSMHDNSTTAGAIRSYHGDTLTLINTSIGDNTGTTVGGIYAARTRRLNLINVTITNNSATDPSASSAGIYFSGTGLTTNQLYIRNTIVGGNFSASNPDCYTDRVSVISEGYNLVQDPAGCNAIWIDGDITGQPPLLGGLNQPGYYPPLLGSPAIDFGNPADPGSGGTSCEAADQLGTPRPVDGNGDSTTRCDIGAYETEPPDPSIISSLSVFSGSNQIVRTGAAFSTLTAIVRDQYNAPVEGVAVTFTAPPTGPSGVFSDSGTNETVVVTGANGRAEAAVFTANLIEGSFTVQAAITQVPEPIFFPLESYTPEPTRLEILSGNNQFSSPGIAFAMPLQVVVRDELDIPLAGIEVTFTAPALGAGVLFTDTGLRSVTQTTDENGIVSSGPFTATGESGSFTVVATADGYAPAAEFALTNLALFVAPDGNDLDDCQTSATACQTINAAIAKATAGLTIYVAGGTYLGADTASVVSIHKSISISGGWNADFSVQDSETILDGQNVRQVMSVSPPVSENMIVVSLDRLTIQRGLGTKGAGISAYKTNLFIANSTISDNHAIHEGGGISYSGKLLEISNTTITQNLATGKASYGRGGGGLSLDSLGGAMLIQNSTITNNQAYQGAGILKGYGTLTLRNSILANNSLSNTGADSDCQGSGFLSDHNIIGSTTGCTITPGSGDQFNVDPLITTYPIGRLGYHALLPGSPAIDAGDPATCLPLDQRGLSRPQGAACDIGSFESTGTSGSPHEFGIAGGNHQSTAPELAFPEPLYVYVVDEFGNPVPGIEVTFISPDTLPNGFFEGSGATSSIVITDGGGVAASPILIANSGLGEFTVTATATGMTGSADFDLTITALYVSPVGSDSASCSTPTTPCLTINGAHDKAVAGNTIFVSEGIYTGTGTSPVVTITKAVTLSGGWSNGFTQQDGETIVDGQKARQAISVNTQDIAAIDHFIVQNGFSYSAAGGIDISGIVVIRNSTIRDNVGGGIRTNGSSAEITTIIDSAVTGNTTPQNGAGFYNIGATLHILNSSIINNTADGSNGVRGGGIYNAIGRVYIQNSTIAGNIADVGAGAYNDSTNGIFSILNTTITGNYAPFEGGGFRSDNGTVVVQNSILAGNQAPSRPDCSGITTSVHNLIGTTAGCNRTSISGDLENIDPELLPILVGSPGFYPLQVGSPAIDAGFDCLTLDQRGVTRPQGTACDIGAFEYNGPGTTPTYLLVYLGSPQYIIPGNPALTNPTAIVLDEAGSGIPGVSVTFTAPDSGPSGTFNTTGTTSTIVSTDSNGIASAGTFTANTTMGAYIVQATAGGIPDPAEFYLANFVQVQTYTMNNNGDPFALPGTFLCNEGSPGCTNSANPHADKAHQFAIGTYQFYLDQHGRSGIDDNNMPIISSVHFGSDYENAGWNGTQMIYGDAYGYPLADDVVAHELTHGVTQYESNLFYYYQSGAINESFSDLWGEMYDQSNGVGVDVIPWQIGEDISGLGVLRSMSDPLIYGDPDAITHDYYYTGPLDNGGVHTNSGVNNKAAYLMIDGGTFNSVAVTSLGADKTLAIYYEVQTHLLTSGADYADLYNALYQACLNLAGGTAGITTGDCQEVRDASNAVRMNQQPASDPNYNPDSSLCTGVTISSYFNDFESGITNFAYGAIVGAQRWRTGSPYGDFAHSGNDFLYADDYPPAIADVFTRTATPIFIPSGSYLRFDHAYDFEQAVINGTLYNFDGGVLEYSTNGGSTWVDAAPMIVNNGYRGTIYNAWNNPLKGRSGFVGASHGYISTRLNLSNLAGQSVMFRWRMGLDDTGFMWGWWLDDVHVYTCEVASTGNTDVYIGPPRKGSFDVLSNQLTIRNYASLLDGPVRVVNNNSDTTFTSQRVTSGASYNELMGVPPAQFTTEYWFPFYDHGYSSVPGNAMRTWVLVGNPDQDLTAQVDIYIGGTLRGSYSIPPGDNITPRWQGTVDGPVRVVSTNGVDIFASERVFTVPNNSFNETFGYPADQFTTEYWFPWYDSVSMNASILVGNTSSVDPAEVDIYIGPNFMGSYTIAANDTLIQSYPSTVNGPVRVVSTNGIDIVASEAALSGPVGNFTAYNEVMGYPFDQFATEYWFPYYDHGYPSIGGSNMRTWVLVGNPDDTLTADVDIYIAGVLQGSYSIPPGSRVTPRWTGLQSGPVHVVSDIPVFTSERVFTSPSNVFNEMMGYPASQLTFEYWFPWYDSINMTANIIIARP